MAGIAIRAGLLAVSAAALLLAGCKTVPPPDRGFCPIPVDTVPDRPEPEGPLEQVDEEGRTIVIPDDGIRNPSRPDMVPLEERRRQAQTRGGAQPACCPAAPNGWRFVYYLAPNKTRSIKKQFGRCGYRKIADDNDAMVALIDTNNANAIVEVERVLTRNAVKFDIVATLTDQGVGNQDPNCQVCHSLTVVAPTPAGHYIYNGTNLAPIINANPAAGTVVAFNKLGQRIGNRKALRNNRAPY